MRPRDTLKTRATRVKDVRRLINDLQTRRSVARDAHNETEAQRLQRLIDVYRDELKQLEAA